MLSLENIIRKKNELTATRFAEIQTNQLHHVWFQKIYIPPWNSLCFGKWACILCIKCWCWAVDGFLWNSSAFGADLHGSLMKVTQKTKQFRNMNKFSVGCFTAWCDRYLLYQPQHSTLKWNSKQEKNKPLIIFGNDNCDAIAMDYGNDLSI